MPGLVLFAAAHVHQVERAVLRLAAPGREPVGAQGAHAEAAGDGVRRPHGRGLCGLRGRRRRSLGPVLEIAAGQHPVHGALVQGRHRIGEAGVDQGLAAQNAAGLAAAVNHDRGLGIGHKVGDAVEQFGHRQVDGTRHRRRMEILDRAAIDDH